MKLILLKDLPLGEEGDIINIKSAGYARNYLIPNKLALLCNKQNLSLLESKKKAIEHRRELKLKEAINNQKILDSTTIKIKVQSHASKLYGTVTSQMILDELLRNGIKGIEKRNIEVPKNYIKTVGDYKIKIRLYGSQESFIKLKIESKNDKVKEQSVDDKDQEK